MPLVKKQQRSKKLHQFNFYLEENIYEKLKELSKKYNLSMAEVVRTLILDAK